MTGDYTLKSMVVENDKIVQTYKNNVEQKSDFRAWIECTKCFKKYSETSDLSLITGKGLEIPKSCECGSVTFKSVAKNLPCGGIRHKDNNMGIRLGELKPPPPPPPSSGNKNK